MNQTTDQTKPKLVQCQKCAAMVGEHRIEAHLKKAHDPSKINKSRVQDNRAAVEAARGKYLATLVRCSGCNSKIQVGSIKRHFAETHSSPASPEMLALVGLSEPTNMFRSDRERESYWRKVSGIQASQGEDLFDKTRVLNGGAFGLGKSRRH